MKKIKVALLVMLVIFAACVGLVWYLLRQTVNVPEFVINQVNSRVLSTMDMKLESEKVVVDFPARMAMLENVKLYQLDNSKSFIDIALIVVSLTPETGIRDLYNRNITIKSIQIDDLKIDLTNYASDEESEPLDLAVIPETKLTINGIDIKHSLTNLQFDGFCLNLNRSEQEIGLSIAYEKDLAGGRASLDANVDITSMDANINLSWQNENFATFAPLIFLKLQHGISLQKGSACIELEWAGNIQQLLSPIENWLEIVTEQTKGRIQLDKVQMNYSGVDISADVMLSRKNSNPWNGSAEIKGDEFAFELDVDWLACEKNEKAFKALMHGKNISLPFADVEIVKEYLNGFQPGVFDIDVNVAFDGTNMNGKGVVNARDWQYDFINVRDSSTEFLLEKSSSLIIQTSVISEIGSLSALIDCDISDLSSVEAKITGNVDDFIIDKLPFDFPIAGKVNSQFAAQLNMSDLSNTTYKGLFSVKNADVFDISPQIIKGEFKGRGLAWDIIDPEVVFSDGSYIKTDGSVRSDGFDCRIEVSNVDLSDLTLDKEIVSGKVYLKAVVKGDLLSPTVKGETWAKEVKIYGESLHSFKAKVQIEKELLELKPVVIKPSQTDFIDGYFALNFLTGEIEKFQFNFQNIDLEFIKGFLPPDYRDSIFEGTLSGNILFDSSNENNRWAVNINGRDLNLLEHKIDLLLFEGNIIGEQGEVNNLFVRAFDGELNLSGHILGKDHFEGDVEISSLSLAKVPVLQSFLPGISGNINCQGSLLWQNQYRNGHFTLYGSDLKMLDRELGNFGGVLSVDNDGLVINNAQFDRLGITIDGDLGWYANKPYDLQIKFDRADFSFLTSAYGLDLFDYEGLVVSGVCSAQGNLDDMIPDYGKLEINSLAMQRNSDIIVANRPIEIIYQNDVFQIRSLELKYRQGLLGVEGLYRPNADIALTISGEKFALRALGSLFNLPEWNYDGKLSLDASIHGYQPQINVKANVKVENFSLNQTVVPKISADFELDSMGLNIKSSEIVLPSSSSQISGIIDIQNFTDIKNIDLRMVIPHSPLNDLAEYLPDIFRESKGSIEADISLYGLPGNFEVFGDASVTGESIVISGLRERITDLDFRLSTINDVLTIDAMKANLGGGNIVGTGNLNFRDGPGLIDFALQGKRLDLSFMNMELSDANLDFSAKGDLYNPVLRGKINIPRGRFNITADLLQTRDSSVLPFKSLDYRFSVNIPSNFWLRSSYINAEMKGNFSVFGDLENFGMDGGIECIQGNIYFQRRQFRIEEGEMNFGGVDNVFDPYFSLRTQGRIQNTQIFLTLQGRLTEFTPRLYSSPPMAEGDLLALLTVGRDLSSLGQSENGAPFENQIFEGLKSSYISALVGDTLSSALNLDELFLSSLFDKSSGQSRSYIRAGRYVGRNFYVAYEGTLDETEDETYIFEYRLPRGFMVNLEFKEPEKETRIGVKYDWRFW